MLFEIQSNESKEVPIKKTIYFYPLTYFRQIGLMLVCKYIIYIIIVNIVYIIIILIFFDI